MDRLDCMNIFLEADYEIAVQAKGGEHKIHQRLPGIKSCILRLTLAITGGFKGMMLRAHRQKISWYPWIMNESIEIFNA